MFNPRYDLFMFFANFFAIRIKACLVIEAIKNYGNGSEKFSVRATGGVVNCPRALNYSTTGRLIE